MSFNTCHRIDEPISSPFPNPPLTKWSTSNRLRRAALPPIRTQDLLHYIILDDLDKARRKGAIIPTQDAPSRKDWWMSRRELKVIMEYFVAIEKLAERFPKAHQTWTVDALRDAYFPRSSTDWYSDRLDCFGGHIPTTRQRIVGIIRSPHSAAELRKREKVVTQMRHLHTQVNLAYDLRFPPRPPPKSPMEFYERPQVSPTSPYATPTEPQFCHRSCSVPRWSSDDKGNYDSLDSVASTSPLSLISDVFSSPEADEDSSMRAMYAQTPRLDTPPLDSNWSPIISPETTKSNGHETGIGADDRLSTIAMSGTPICGDVSLEDTSPGPEERGVKGSGWGMRKSWNSFTNLVSLLSPKKLVPMRRKRSRSSDRKRTPESD